MTARHRNPQGEMPFLEHLEELRWRIFRSVLALGVGALVGWFVVQRFRVMELLIRPGRGILENGQLLALNPATGFFVTVKLAVGVGIVLALPFVVREIWGFLSPGLRPGEKRVIVPSLYFGLVLFCAGAAMAYFWVLPLAFTFLAGFQGDYLGTQYEVGEYIHFVTMMLVAFGVAFELPIVILILSVLELVTPRFLREKRRHAIVVITIVASMLTPGDLVSTFMMLAPLLVLYEGSIFLSVMVYRRKARQEETILAPAPEPPPGSVGAEGP